LTVDRTPDGGSANGGSVNCQHVNGESDGASIDTPDDYEREEREGLQEDGM
jgi:hypothetical protein